MTRYAILIVLAALLWIPSAVRAFSVSPGTMELSGARGEVIETEFTLINAEEVEQTYYLGTMKFVPRDNGGSPEFIPAEVDLSGFPEWISFPSSSVSVPAQSVVKVPVTIAIPADVASGGYYAALVISDAPYEVVETNGTTVNARTAILAFLTVEGETEEKIALLDFESSISGKALSDISGSWSYRIQNQGNVHVAPQATILVEDALGRVLLSQDANETGGRVLPGSTRTYEGAFATDTSAGFWKSVKRQAETFAIGPATATLTVTDGEDRMTSHVNFWIIPWQLLVVIGLVVLSTVALLVLARKKK